MRSRWIAVTMAGVLSLSAFTSVSCAEDKEKNEKDEVQVKFDDLPAPVKATLNKESGNAKVDSVDKEMKNGKTAYEADVTMDGKPYEIKIAEDGSLLSKKLDDDKDEHGDKKDEKEEKDEKH